MFNEVLTIWSMCPSGFSLLSPTPETVLPSFVLWEVQGYLQFRQNGSTSSLSLRSSTFSHTFANTQPYYFQKYCIVYT